MQKYTVSVPVIDECITEENRDLLLQMLKNAQVDRVVLTFHGVNACDPFHLRENAEYFQANGLEVALWVGHTIGHIGAEFYFGEQNWIHQPLVNREGKAFPNTFCPLDPGFQLELGARIAQIAEISQVKLILLDDDCCLSQKGFSCTCHRHMARIRKTLGEDISREALVDHVFTGKASRYRDAWMQAQGDSIVELAQVLRQETDKRCPDVTLALCTAFSHWSFDGLDVCKVTQILAGKNPQVLRLHGAPYWSVVNNKHLAGVCETARMFASFCKNRGITLLAEGDAYPRPRTNCSASRLNIHDAVMRADGGHNGILKYMVNYTSYPEQEPGYLERHSRCLDIYEKIQAFFPDGANAGVRVWIHPNLVQQADLDFAPELFRDVDLSQYPSGVESPRSSAGHLLSCCGIPTVYDGTGMCTAVFGENARHIDRSILQNGAILDAAAARILWEQGVDVGIHSLCPPKKTNLFQVFQPGYRDGDPLPQGESSRVYLSRFQLKPGCTPVLFGKGPQQDAVLAYTYENKAGTRFLVLTMDGYRLHYHNSAVSRSYAMQRMLKKWIPWVARSALCVVCPEAPGLYVLCHQSRDSLSVLLCNICEDSLYDPTFTVSGTYSYGEFAGCTGRVRGNTFVLEGELPAFSFAAVRLTKQEDTQCTLNA